MVVNERFNAIDDTVVKFINLIKDKNTFSTFGNISTNPVLEV